MIRIMLSLMLLPLAVQAGEGPSFDCARASTATEHAICGSAALSALDRQIAERYAKVRGLADVKPAQRAWIRDRDRSCASLEGDGFEACLVASYAGRSAELTDRSGEQDPRAMTSICSGFAEEAYASGVTTRMQRAGDLTSICLRAVLFVVGRQRLDAEDWDTLVENAGEAVGALDWVVNNRRKRCGGSCGTMYYTLHADRVNDYYRSVIEKIYRLDEL